MPVLITGASGFIGRALARRLLEEGAEVRAYLRRDDADLRAAGVHIAIGSAEQVEPLEAALTNVHTIVHLTGGWWPEGETTLDRLNRDATDLDRLNRDTTETAVIAAKASRVKRFVFMSFPGADPGSPNAFLAAKGKAERHIVESGLEHVIFRCAPVAGRDAPFASALKRMRRRGIALLPGAAGRMISAVAIDDVVDALVAADARDVQPSGVWELGGPEPVALAAIAADAGIGRVIYAGMFAGAPKAFVQLLARDIVVDPSEAADRFGLSLRSVL